MPTTNSDLTVHAGLIEEYFDEHAQSWHDYYMGGKSLTHIVLKERMRISLAFLDKYLNPGNHPTILDAGCGSGLIGVAMARRGCQVDGWDISEKMIAISRKNFEEAQIPSEQYTLTTGNLLEHDLPEGTYDGIMALGFLQYQPNEVEVLQQFHRLLKPGGILIMSGPVGTNLSNYLGLAEKIKRFRRRGRKRKASTSAAALDREHLHTISANDYSLKRFRNLMKSADFDLLEYKGHGYAHFEFISRKLKNRYQIKLHRFLTRASKILPIQRWGNDMVIVARK